MRKFKNYNLILVGFGRDVNGNSIIKLRFNNSRGFSIQIGNGCFEHTYYCSSKNLFNILDSDIDIIENEVIEYIKEYGSKNQKVKLRIAKN